MMNAKLLCVAFCLLALAPLGCEQSRNPRVQPTMGRESNSPSVTAANQFSDRPASSAQLGNTNPRTDYEKRQEELRVEIQNYTDELDNVFALISQPEGDVGAVESVGSPTASTSYKSSLPVSRR